MIEDSSRFRSNQRNNANGSLTTGDLLLNDKYVLSQLIGKGSFGQVYRGVYTQKDESKRRYPKNVAIKIQNDLSKATQIANQVTLLNDILSNKKYKNCFPKVHASGIENGRTFMIMDLLGPNLQDLMILCGGKFSMKTALLLIVQIFQRVEAIHELGYIYRDIKPQNFLMGIGDNSQNVYMVDFGLCKRYRDANTKLLVPYKQATSMVGTIRYSSINAHLGIDQSRRDDLQCVCYLLIYFLKGELPWQKIPLENKFEKDHMMMSCKLKMTARELCEGLPSEIENIFQYIKSLNFYQEPDYHYILSELSFVLEHECGPFHFTYDWESLEREEKLMKTHLEMIITTDSVDKTEIEEIKEESEDDGKEVKPKKAVGRVQQRFSNFKDK